MVGAGCPFRDLVGPLQAASTLPEPVDAQRLSCQVQAVYVERATCQMLGHAYHVVCAWRDSVTQEDGWWSYRGSRDLFRELTVWKPYQLAPGSTGTEPCFVLVPRPACPERAHDA